MKRFLAGLAICLFVGVGIELSGLGHWVERRVALSPPPIPGSWAPTPPAGAVEVTLVASAGYLQTLAVGLSESEIAIRRPEALALVDGRIYAAHADAARHVLSTLAWDGLPIEARIATTSELSRLEAPAPAGLGWRARHHAHVGLRAGRDLIARYPSASVASLATAVALLIQSLTRTDRTGSSRQPFSRPHRDAPSRFVEAPVRVVLVPDVESLAHVRTAIGEEHVVGATEHAFAFSDGWILAARKGSVFELVGEIGWHTRPLEMAARPDLVAEGHTLSPVPSDGAADTFDVLEALQLCGPLAHGSLPA